MQAVLYTFIFCWKKYAYWTPLNTGTCIWKP